MPDSVTQILNSGPPGAKLNIAVLGDGFAAADQTAYNNKVQGASPRRRVRPRLLLRGQVGLQHLPRQPDLGPVRGQPARSTTRRGRRRTRPTTRSSRRRSGTRRSATSTAARGRTAGWRAAPAPAPRSQNALDTWVPGLRPRRHHPQRGRLRRLRRRRLPDRHARRRAGRSWPTSSATAPAGSPTSTARSRGRTRGGEPGAVNVTVNTNRATLKWRQLRQPDDAGPDRHRLLRRLQRGPEAGRLERQPETSGSSRAAAPGRRGIYRPDDQLPHARQLAAVLPGLLHADEVEARSRYAQHTFQNVLRRRLQRRRQGRHPRPQRQLDPHLPLERIAARRRLQRRRARAGLVAVHARRPLLRRRLQRRRQGRGRRLQRHELGAWSTSACSPTTAPTASG